ncbi:MAG: VacB/RNase II family 3'-5' exoribonuclease [Mailhella sp.]|nr:VacB/RNase II family 3'-5' exoribonuclease [Mailhella sp.]
MKKKDNLDEQLLIETLENAGRPLRLDDILRITGFSRKIKKDVLICLGDLAANGVLVRLQGGGWATASSMKTRTGRLAVQRSGAAFVIPEGEAPRSGSDIYIAAEHIGDAWNGDIVSVMLMPAKRGSSKGPEGRILSVIERGQTEIVARVLRPADGEGVFLCRPCDPRLGFDIAADASALEKRPEESELLRISVGGKTDDGGRRPLYAGTALSSLGQENDAFVQERLTKLNNSIPMEFPDNVLAEAEEAAASPALDEEGLADLRGEMLVTIDGDDARDFDDAVCASRDGDGWRLLVAIADVSHYVRPRTNLDREAFERGNSYYFPTSVEPMLPEVLCNGVCSLRPNEERRCMAADMRLDAGGNFVSVRFSNGVMVSKARLTYTEVQSALVDPEGDAARAIDERAPGVRAMLEDAADLADVLIERRRRQGGLDFDLPEAEFLVDGIRINGVSRVTGIRNRERLFSHRLIEAFMVRANEAVAEFLTKHDAPFLYRVHPAPGADRLEDLYRSLRSTDAELPLPHAAKTAVPNWIAHVLDAAAGTDQEFVVNRLTLRSMMQARYSPEEDGHFGLGSACYCHFTSPIRRYADLVNHRALRYVLGLETGGALPAGHRLLETADRCNEHERTATDAEREIGRRMGCLLLQGRTGDIFGGVVSGVMSYGFFVELDGMPVEGMVRVESLGRDFYVYDEERQELRGTHTGESFRLGQRVTVKLAGVHVGRLEIDLEYRNDDEGRRPFRRRDDDRNDRREGGREGRGRHAFADRRGFRPRRDEDGQDFRSGKPRFERRGEGRPERPHGFRPRRDDDAERRNRYASDAWGGEEAERGGRPFGERRGFRSDRDGEGRDERPHGFKPRRDDEGRGFQSDKPRFERRGRDGEDAGRRPFHKDGGFGDRRRPFGRGDDRFADRRGHTGRREEADDIFKIDLETEGRQVHRFGKPRK